ncbi:MAG: hypothetical protein HPY61_09340 [Methanotrichaceae archaeon]|nr:hypothetical protein [Methanotrichaceae archaeon]
MTSDIITPISGLQKIPAYIFGKLAEAVKQIPKIEAEIERLLKGKKPGSGVTV